MVNVASVSEMINERLVRLVEQRTLRRLEQ